MLKLQQQNVEYSLPAGMRILEQDVEVECIALHTSQAKRFIARSRQSIHFECVQIHKIEASLIRVIGTSKKRFLVTNECIGYVPVDVARCIFDAGIEDKVHARLRSIYTGDRDHIRIIFDLFGPLDSYGKYHSTRRTSVSEGCSH